MATINIDNASHALRCIIATITESDAYVARIALSNIELKFELVVAQCDNLQKQLDALTKRRASN